MTDGGRLLQSSEALITIDAAKYPVYFMETSPI